MELLIFFSSKNSFFYLSKISLNRIKVFNRKLTFYFWSPTNRNYKTFFVSKKTHTRQRPSFSEISKKSKKQSKTVVRKRIIFFWERRVEKKNKSWRNNFFFTFSNTYTQTREYYAYTCSTADQPNNTIAISKVSSVVWWMKGIRQASELLFSSIDYYPLFTTLSYA